MSEGDYYTKLMGMLTSVEIRVELPKDLEDILFRRGVVKTRFDDRRRFVRRYFPVKAILELTTTLPTIARQHSFHSVITRDLSRMGISFFFHEQLFPGEQPVLWLTTGKLACKVVRCLRHNAKCFEIGATVIKDDLGPQKRHKVPESMVRAAAKSASAQSPEKTVLSTSDR